MTIFFYGPNRYELQRQLHAMTAAYVQKAGSDTGLERLDGATVIWRVLTAAVQAVPFLANSRLVIVEGLTQNKTVAAKLPDLMKLVPPSTVVVFVEREVDQRTVAFKTLKTADKVMKFEPLSGPKLINWVRAEAQKLGGSMDAAVAHKLVERAGEDQWRLSGEIHKLVHYEPQVSPEAVRELVAASVERTIFDLVEAMTAGKVAETLQFYRALLQQRESEMYVLTMVQWQLRNVLLAKLAPATLGPPELAAAAGMSPYVAGKAAALQGRIDEEVLKRAFIAAVDCEYEIKSGRIKSELAVERLLYRVASDVQSS
jgi:DNA polymerase III subunit delta